MTMYKDKQVVIIGAARQGTALARYLARNGANVVLNDSRRPSQLREARRKLQDEPIGWVLGAHPVRLLDTTEFVCPSGGVPLELPIVAEARRRGIPLSNDSQIFLETARCPVIGITGSAGKTTTTTLLGRMAKATLGDEKVWMGGNIGNPLIEHVEHMRPDHVAISELSSFQLDIMTRSPSVAAVLNITPNHLDRHGTMQAYTQAKANILAHQTPDDIAILSRDDPGAWGLADHVRGRLATFGHAPAPRGQGTRTPEIDVYIQGDAIYLRDATSTQKVMPLSDVQLRGAHNLNNVLAACALAGAAGFPVAAMQAGMCGFTGVVHRLEFVRTWGGADWYNDSIATAPERAMAGVRAFDAPLVLLAGGKDKDLSWDDFARLICARVDHLIAFGETGEMLAEKVAQYKNDRPFSVTVCESLQPAVQAATAVAQSGDVVLLSPGGTSFDEFRDFATRGEMFKQWINQLP